MSIQTAFQKCFGFFGEKPIVVEASAGALTSDAGLLPVREFDERIGFTELLAAALHDPRHQPFVDHTFPEMVRMRIYGILADYADQNDHDVLRTDPVFKLIAVAAIGALEGTAFTPRSARTVVMFTIAPPPCSRMCGTTACAQWWRTISSP